MSEAFRIFINGITGVFAGMAILYLVVKLIALTAGRPASGEERK
jgi:Na+-transporting methylmalonyl-CoA/oxaloacetate decarboxylase gamma subunit